MDRALCCSILLCVENRRTVEPQNRREHPPTGSGPVIQSQGKVAVGSPPSSALHLLLPPCNPSSFSTSLAPTNPHLLLSTDQITRLAGRSSVRPPPRPPPPPFQWSR
ncbi:hypothetical protein CRUP_017602 [Coryphaenoides rupestris]|nr:hypothetical protein CRUP_017602 [Coryphaenoides rupestris]